MLSASKRQLAFVTEWHSPPPSAVRRDSEPASRTDGLLGHRDTAKHRLLVTGTRSRQYNPPWGWGAQSQYSGPLPGPPQAS